MYIVIFAFEINWGGKNTKYVLICRPRWSNLFKRLNEEKYQSYWLII